jgi:hypothetical protein
MVAMTDKAELAKSTDSSLTVFILATISLIPQSKVIRACTNGRRAESDSIWLIFVLWQIKHNVPATTRSYRQAMMHTSSIGPVEVILVRP